MGLQSIHLLNGKTKFLCSTKHSYAIVLLFKKSEWASFPRGLSEDLTTIGIILDKVFIPLVLWVYMYQEEK